ncbi:MAG: hypothetical protein HY327_07030 [Chloroflexi bacterium]|nr:hypothetical protein [Chloroflexota bacterium]
MKRTWSAAFALALALMILFVQVASAHERRTVGKYEFVVGFLNEPAYIGQPNAASLAVTDTETKKPVEGLEKTIKVEIIFGGKTLPLDLRARFGQPGAYVADFIPTKAGTYIFRFTGKIDALNVDEKFESGPGRFNDVQDTTALQFPEKLPAPLDVAAQVQAARDTASNAQTIAYAALALGLVGSALGAFALRRR